MSSPHNASGYYGLKEEINDALSKEHFQATLSGSGDTSIVYARTGFLGFMIKAEDNAKSKGMFTLFCVTSTSCLSTCVYVVVCSVCVHFVCKYSGLDSLLSMSLCVYIHVCMCA